MWEQNHRYSIPEVAHRFIGSAKRAVGDDGGTIVQIEATSVDGSDPRFQELINLSELVVWPEVAEPCEEDIIRGL